ncbi:hypothetical protein AVEN_271591-1 [Araneus ventricosus]|uniref:Uncharacterized protein n=1 Tax=Araneus ventricosus TaxID=182803 RepID=A0A4Y2IXP3_ARAVE|nr:hypothetical protein AVEN_271591-1 [Araneus ventricosus]
MPTSTNGLKKEVGLPSTGLEISATQVYLFTTKKIEPLLVSPLPKISLRSPSSLFLLTSIVLLLGERSRGLSMNPRQFCRWSIFQRAIIGSLPFWSFPLSQASSQAGDKLPYPSLPLTSSPQVTEWTPGSLCRRFNEMSGVGKLDFPLRHLLCSVTHVRAWEKSYWSLMILGDLTLLTQLCHFLC